MKDHGKKAWNRFRAILSAAALSSAMVLSGVSVRAEEEPSAAPEWEFTYFGVSVNESRNRLVSAEDGINGDVSLASATFKAAMKTGRSPSETVLKWKPETAMASRWEVPIWREAIS